MPSNKFNTMSRIGYIPRIIGKEEVISIRYIKEREDNGKITISKNEMKNKLQSHRVKLPGKGVPSKFNTERFSISVDVVSAST